MFAVSQARQRNPPQPLQVRVVVPLALVRGHSVLTHPQDRPLVAYQGVGRGVGEDAAAGVGVDIGEDSWLAGVSFGFSGPTLSMCSTRSGSSATLRITKLRSTSPLLLSKGAQTILSP